MLIGKWKIARARKWWMKGCKKGIYYNKMGLRDFSFQCFFLLFFFTFYSTFLRLSSYISPRNIRYINFVVRFVICFFKLFSLSSPSYHFRFVCVENKSISKKSAVGKRATEGLVSMILHVTVVALIGTTDLGLSLHKSCYV